MSHEIRTIIHVRVLTMNWLQIHCPAQSLARTCWPTNPLEFSMVMVCRSVGRCSITRNVRDSRRRHFEQLLNPCWEEVSYFYFHGYGGSVTWFGMIPACTAWGKRSYSVVWWYGLVQKWSVLSFALVIFCLRGLPESTNTDSFLVVALKQIHHLTIRK